MKIRNSKWLFVAVLLAGNITLCTAAFKEENSAYPLHFLDRQLTLILINDNFSPPVAARVYAYTGISAYTILVESKGKENKLRNSLLEFPKVDAVTLKGDYSSSLASAFTFYYISKKLIYTFAPFDDSFKVLLNWYKANGCTDAEIENSKNIAKQYADSLGEWIRKDNFAETRRMSDYILDDVVSHWVPTYPGYMSALEPNWGKIRHLNANAKSIGMDKFMPIPFDTARGSAFYKEGIGVYHIAGNATKEQLHIADFWDCNAFEIFPEGHIDNVIKKMSPGGHWMSIVSIACRKDKADIYKSAYAYALTATALFEGFIHTWDIKYKFKSLRPETYLQNIGYPDFRPYLQSPPFPEYPSGHAVISMAAATVLTSIFGNSFDFRDNTEDPWGIAARSFPNFVDAATEAGISRFYGNIHYKYACEDGSKIGAVIGSSLLSGMKK
jgi:hypothetical protein